MHRLLLILLLVGGGAWVAWEVHVRRKESDARGKPSRERVVPVEVAPVRVGPIEDRRTFNGGLEAKAEFMVAPKVAGRVERIMVDLADEIQRGQVVAKLDDAEFVQAVAQAEAEKKVALATDAEARSRLAIATRALTRADELRGRGVASDAEYDAAKAEYLARQAALEVAGARLLRSTAELESAKIREGYTRVQAVWSGGSDRRVVAGRRVDPGETVGANTPILSVVELDPLNAVIFVAERDYASLKPGLAVTLRTDAWPDRTFVGHVARIAPVFRQASRQARVEVTVPNPDGALRPGMFVTAETVLRRADQATIVPLAALVTRGDDLGVFVVDSGGETVAWHAVKRGIRDGERVQVIGEGIEGRVVTLGLALVADGSRVRIPTPKR